MTITPEAPTLNAPVDIRFTKAGTPLAVRYDGRIWAVTEEPRNPRPACTHPPRHRS
jgi:hypothetical protein